MWPRLHYFARIVHALTWLLKQIGKEFLHGHSRDKLLVIGATAQRSSAPEVAKLKIARGRKTTERRAVLKEGKRDYVRTSRRIQAVLTFRRTQIETGPQY